MGIITTMFATFRTSSGPPGPSFNGTTHWRLYQATNTRTLSDAYAWHLGSFVMTGVNSLGQVVNATASITTSTTQRGGTVNTSQFYNTGTGYGIFASYLAGQYLQIQFPVAVKVTSVQYKNPVGAQWAPTIVEVRSSSNGSTWTTKATYNDNASTSIQTITVP